RRAVPRRLRRVRARAAAALRPRARGADGRAPGRDEGPRAAAARTALPAQAGRQGTGAAQEGDTGVSGPVLRTMTCADLAVVRRLEERLFPDDPWSEEMFRAELADQPRTRHYVVAEEPGGEIVGY